jgi:putative oxygen-independent coproporphyrinogen III oxidase
MTVLTALSSSSPVFKALPPLALYVHVPWCLRKCPYCDFNSHELRGELPAAEYARALVADLEHALPLVWGRQIYSVFFGGGTPSLLPAENVDEILSAIRARLPLATDAEITLEANPGTFEAARFRAFREAGINRLSIGVQSFDSRHLKTLGRVHDEREARVAIEAVRSTFDNFNLDLMYGLPGQTVEEARADLLAALAYEPPHLSVYHLTIEPNTYFHRYPPAVPDDDITAEMQANTEALLAERGYDHYETSAYARPGRRSRHNLNYWTFGDYLGIGAGAHSKISFPDRILRQVRHKQPRQYMEMAGKAAPVMEEHDVPGADVPFEFMLNALRLTEGVPAALFQERAGLPLTSALRALEEAERRGLITRDHVRIVPTPLGQRFLNDLLEIFLPQKQSASIG